MVNKKPEINNYCEIIHSENYIKDEESPLTAAKKSESTSMWKSIESQKNGKSQITLSAGNTGAMFILSRLILNMIDGIEKPALAGLWPNKIVTQHSFLFYLAKDQQEQVFQPHQPYSKLI